MISSLRGSASRTHVEALGMPRDSTSVLEALPSKLDITRQSPRILYIPAVFEYSNFITGVYTISMYNQSTHYLWTKHVQISQPSNGRKYMYTHSVSP